VKIAATATIAIGFALLLLSGLWTSLFSSQSSWTDEKAQRSVQVKARMAYVGSKVNLAAGTKPGPDYPKMKTEFDDLLKENDQLNSEFSAVHDQPGRTAALLRWSGIAIAVVGVVGWYAARQ
jgi:hypothetical protein